LKKPALIALVLAAACFVVVKSGLMVPRTASVPDATAVRDERLAAAIANRHNGIHVEGSGIVSKVLPDDQDGSRHQRFIVELPTGQTLLIAHNIDIAERIASLQPGDRVEFCGDYEWNPRGGVIHWTHHDPAGRHVSGWIRHSGSTYR
jgi:hypothetical protein